MADASEPLHRIFACGTGIMVRRRCATPAYTEPGCEITYVAERMSPGLRERRMPSGRGIRHPARRWPRRRSSPAQVPERFSCDGCSLGCGQVKPRWTY